MANWTLGWWFTVPDGDGVVRLNNGREVIDGQTIPVDKGTRASGCLPLRASEHAMDAMHCAPPPPGLIICRVRPSGVVSYDGGKKHRASASHLTVLWRVPADALLRVCACDFAERALNRERASGREPDPRSWHAVEVARRFADGAGSVDELVTARNLAGLAADDAPNAAAANAAWSAARCASVDPAWAADAAAWSAAKSAMDAVGADQQESTRMAAWDAEREWQIAHMDAVFLAAGEGDAPKVKIASASSSRGTWAIVEDHPALRIPIVVEVRRADWRVEPQSVVALIPGIAAHGIGVDQEAAIEDLLGSMREARDELRRDVAAGIDLVQWLETLLAFAQAVLVEVVP